MNYLNQLNTYFNSKKNAIKWNQELKADSH